MLGFIPLPHTVYISNSTELDDWGIPVKDVNPEAVGARVSYNTARESITLSTGEDIVFTADIILKNDAVVTYEDTVTWTDKLGNTYEKAPLQIDYKSDLSGNTVAVKVVV